MKSERSSARSIFALDIVRVPCLKIIPGTGGPMVLCRHSIRIRHLTGVSLMAAALLFTLSPFVQEVCPGGVIPAAPQIGENLFALDDGSPKTVHPFISPVAAVLTGLTDIRGLSSDHEVSFSSPGRNAHPLSFRAPPRL